MVAETFEPRGRQARFAREAAARGRRVPDAPPVDEPRPRAEPAARATPTAATPEPARRGAAGATEATRPVETPPARAETQMAAGNAQLSQLDRFQEAAARQMRVDKGDVMGWWRRKFYVLGNALFGSAIGMGSATLAGKALVGSALAATLPAWVLGAAIGIPSVLLARYVLGLNKVDRMAKAGRIARKGEKGTRKAERAARRAGGTYAISDAELQTKMAELSKRPSYGAIGAGIAAGAFFGAVGYEHTLPSDERPFTDAVKGAAVGTWERVTDPGWWHRQASWLWGAACEATKPDSLGTMVTNPPPVTDAVSPHSHLGSGEAAQKAADALSKPSIPSYSMDIRPAVLVPPETLASTHVAAAESLRESLPATLSNPVPDNVPVETSSPAVSVETVETVDIPEPSEASPPTPEGGGEVSAPPDSDSKLGPLYGGEMPHVPLEVSYGPSDSVARHGIDGLIRQEFFDTMTKPPPIGVQEQFIDAVRRTMVEHPDFAQQLLNTNVDVIHNNDIVFPDSGTLNMRVFGDENFLDELKNTIITHEKSHLLKGLEERQGLDAFIDNFRSAYGEL